MMSTIATPAAITRHWFAVLLLLLSATAHGGALPTGVGWDQRLGESLPLDLTFTDETGARERLGDYFGSVPVVIVFAYFHCARLCPEVLAGVQEGLSGAHLIANRDYRLLAIDIDPNEMPMESAEGADLIGQQGGVHLLSSRTGAEARLASAAGFRYVPTADHTQFAHPAGFMITTPGGTISRYFFGVRYPPDEIRTAINEAREDRTGSLTDRLLVLCAGLVDVHSGRSASILNALRAFSVVALGALAFFAWRAFARTSK
jgi:protein SCO1/2